MVQNHPSYQDARQSRRDLWRAAGIVLCGVAVVVCAMAIGTVFSQFISLVQGAMIL